MGAKRKKNKKKGNNKNEHQDSISMRSDYCIFFI
jgi:hypothetical protein